MFAAFHCSLHTVAQVLLLPYLRALHRLSLAKSSGDDNIARLIASGAPRLVVRLMSWADSTNDEAVMLQCLNLACAMVDGGNRPAQDAFLTEVTRAPRFFASIMRIVKSCGVTFPTMKVCVHSLP